jgi:ATP-binding cassette subfamily B protein
MTSRRFFIPEVVQTSGMDCGPAALTSLLQGHGVPASYGRLREACQTDVDGTSIDTLEDLGNRLGLDAEQTMIPVDHLLLDEAEMLPAIVVVQGGNGLTHFVVLERRGNTCVIVEPTLQRRTVSAAQLAAALCAEVEKPHQPAIERLLDDTGVRGRRRATARAHVTAQRVSKRRVAVAWSIRFPPGAEVLPQLREAGVPRRALLHVVAFAAALALDVAAWALVGRGALSGRLDWGFLVAWALVLVTAVPIHAAGAWLAGLVALDVGAVLKRRLLAGALSLDPEEVKHLGAGGHLSRAIEGEEVESLGLGTASVAAAAVLELAVAAGLLVTAAGVFGVLVLVVHTALLVVLARACFRAREAWTERRLTMTHGLVENLVGHRTRLAQERPDRRHLDEDASLVAWLDASRRMDTVEIALHVVGGRGFLLLALAAVAPLFVAGTASSGGLLAVGLASALLGQRAWRRLTGAVVGGSAAWLAWRKARELWRAAARKPQRASADVAALASSPDAPLVEARGLTFAHAGRSEPVLRDMSVRIDKGARLLLEGPSGAGKSTLASILTGLRTPTSGLALLGGIDHKTLGVVEWRRRVASAPQFHENHILTGTLAFNVLLGRGWPASEQDNVEAEALLRKLGLGPLLERMPSGMGQVVGETGWQLSHGEKSRVFLARALLQRADLVVLDETFGALDPETMKKALETTFERAPALVVIAHP